MSSAYINLLLPLAYLSWWQLLTLSKAKSQHCSRAGGFCARGVGAIFPLVGRAVLGNLPQQEPAGLFPLTLHRDLQQSGFGADGGAQEGTISIARRICSCMFSPLWGPRLVLGSQRASKSGAIPPVSPLPPSCWRREGDQLEQSQRKQLQKEPGQGWVICVVLAGFAPDCAE